MPAHSVLLLLALAAPQAPVSDTITVAAAPVLPLVVELPMVVTDTPRARPRVVEVSDSYETRLRVHRILAYSIPVLFAGQYAAGRRIWSEGAAAPEWARTGHRVGATLIAGVFVANTVTGAMNWWESREAPQGRTLRTVHAASMLVAEAGFTYAGAVLSEQAERDFNKRRLHRTVALGSMGITLASGIAMRLWNH